MIYLLLTVATLLTSVVSGLLSMAGGMILMGVFSFFLSVPVAMVLHGIAQAFSNGSRVWLYRQHIHIGVLAPYTIGALLVLTVFFAFSFVPNIGLIFILIGSFPFIALVMPSHINLDMRKPQVALSSGIFVTIAQMLAGASGPVLDVFYVNSTMTRQEILGTKAVTQTLGHLLKLIYYGSLIFTLGNELPGWVYASVVFAAIGGNWLATIAVARISDDQFKRAGKYIILIIGMIYIGKGIQELLT